MKDNYLLISLLLLVGCSRQDKATGVADSPDRDSFAGKTFSVTGETDRIKNDGYKIVAVFGRDTTGEFRKMKGSEFESEKFSWLIERDSLVLKREDWVQYIDGKEFRATPKPQSYAISDEVEGIMLTGKNHRMLLSGK